MNTAIRPDRKALEDSPEYFWERFSQYAQTWPVSPEPLGSPMLEVLTPMGPLFAFDRGLVPCSKSEIQLILHGQVEHWEPTQHTQALTHLGAGRYQMTGQVEAVLDEVFFVLQVQGDDNGPLQVLLSAPTPPAVGSRVTVRLRPPLMAFRLDGSR